MMKNFASLLFLFGFVFLGECDDDDFYTKRTWRKYYININLQLFHSPCVSVTNFVNVKRQDWMSNLTSTFERRSVGVDDRLFPEASVKGFRFVLSQFLLDYPPLADFSAASGIVVTDPNGKKHFLKNWVHLRIELAETPDDGWSPESIIIQMTRRATHPEFKNVAAQGQFVADFPGYTACEDVRQEIESGVAAKPTPYQFLPCPGANPGDNEYANVFLYNIRAAESHGGIGKKTNTSDFKRVYHLFWKFSDNSCSRMHDEYNLETFVTERYKDNPDHLNTFFTTQFTVKIGNVHEGHGGGNLPSGAADPLPPSGEGWKWNCNQAFMYNDEEGKTHHDIPQLTWLYEYYPKVDNSFYGGDIGSCKISPYDVDTKVGKWYQNNSEGWKEGHFFGRCETIDAERLKKGWKSNQFAVFPPTPDQLPYCFDGKHLDTFKNLNPPQYGSQFGLTFDKEFVRVYITQPDICNKCPAFPTQEEIEKLMPEVVEREAREEAAKKKTEGTEQRRPEETNHTTPKPENKSMEDKEPKPLKPKVYTVRFDDEDDGYWSQKDVKDGSKPLAQKPQSPVAMVGLSVWRYRKLHGIFEVIVVFFVTPVCVFVSRYFKETWLGWRVLEQPPWLMGHLGLSLVALIFHVFGVQSASMGTGLMGSSRLDNVKVHRYLGFGTLLLFFLLNLLGAFRPVGLCARRVCIILHWLFGLLAYALNFACVLTSIGIPGSPSAIDDVSFPSDSMLRTDGVEVVFVLTIFWIVIDILFHAVANGMLCLSDRQEEVTRSYFPALMPCVDEDEMIDTEGSFGRKVLLFAYTIVCGLMTITVVGIIYAQSHYGRAFDKTTLTHNGDDELYGDLMKENRMDLIFPPFF